ncbi:MAG TPA: hypothetical protein VF557_08045 [Jatrophihabitans sp.]|jgi:hypothetical protein|uniref:hypothetical protein n=1 Tax=Jatrophihabitans sp. TaxID=1932789 RepID=UPI002EFFFFBF
MSDERFKLAYDAVVTHLGQQDVTLGNLRNRATAVLSAAALVTSFSAGVGLINTDQDKGSVFPTWGAVTLLAVVVGIGLLTMGIIWPVKGWVYGGAASVILAETARGRDIDTILRDAATSLASGVVSNAKVIDRRSQYFRVAVVLFVAEIAVLTVAVID